MKVCITCGKEYWGNHSQGRRHNCDRCRRRFNREKSRIRRIYRASNPYLVLADLLKKVVKIKQKQELEAKKAKQHAAYLRQKERKRLGLVKRRFLKPRLGWKGMGYLMR
jgi:hypothetical protein